MTPCCVIIGWYGYNNIGDELMLHSLLSNIKNNDLDIIVVSADPQQTERIHDVKSVPVGLSTYKPLIAADKIYFGGGQIFSDKRFRTIPLWASILYTIRLFNKDCQIALLNQGFDAKNKISRKFLSSAVSCTDLISVRDSSSLKLIQSLNLDVPISFGPDILFALDLCDKQQMLVRKGKSNGATIGVNVRPSYWWRDQSEYKAYEQSLASCLDMLIEEYDVKLCFVPFRLPGKELYDDLEFSKEIVTIMKNKDRVSIFNNALDESFISNLINCFNQFDLFIGTALHSLILSCKLGIPFLALPYQRKSELFMNDIGFSQLILNSNEASSPKLMYKRISNTFNIKNEIQSQLIFKERSLYNDSKMAHIEPISWKNYL